MTYLGGHMGGQEEWLTPREAELMPLVCKGMSNQQIAEVLGIREDTVKSGSSGNQTNLTSSAAITRIIDNIDYNHPVAENILLQQRDLPTGLLPSRELVSLGHDIRAVRLR
jgi:hypothetical protein